MTTYEKECKDKAEQFAKSLAPFVDGIGVVKGNDGMSDFRVEITHKGINYDVHKSYNGDISFWIHAQFENLNGHTISEIHGKYGRNKMRVPTQKKVQQLLDDQNAIFAELTALNNAAADKHAKFMQSVKQSPHAAAFKFSKDSNGNVKSGYAEVNGFSYSFELCDNGYISQTLELSYTVDKKLETFNKIAATNA